MLPPIKAESIHKTRTRSKLMTIMPVTIAHSHATDTSCWLNPTACPLRRLQCLDAVVGVTEQPSSQLTIVAWFFVSEKEPRDKIVRFSQGETVACQGTSLQYSPTDPGAGLQARIGQGNCIFNQPVNGASNHGSNRL